MFKGGFGYHGNRYDVIKCLGRNLDIPVTSQSMIYFSNQTHEIFLLNCSNAYTTCMKPSRASLSVREREGFGGITWEKLSESNTFAHLACVKRTQDA